MPFDSTDFVIAPTSPIVETEQQIILRKARALLARREDRWTTAVLATHSELGAAMCIMGAVLLASGQRSFRALNGLTSAHECVAVRSVRPFLCDAIAEREDIEAVRDSAEDEDMIVESYNDNYAEYADVLAVLDRAYELAGLSKTGGE